MIRILFVALVSIVELGHQSKSQAVIQADICIYGGTSAGVIAAYTARKMGKSVIVLEPGWHLGGLSSGGLGFTDIGNKYAVSGLGLDFYRRLGKYYGKPESWIFEPKIARNIFQQYLDESKVKVNYGHRLKSVVSENKTIRVLNIETINKNGKSEIKQFRAKYFIDCTYEGDLMAMAGVSYIVGRESNADYNEGFNGYQMHNKHQFPDGVDPFKTAGDPNSGLLWGISNNIPDSPGTGDKKVQAYNFRICLTNREDNKIAITRPEGYDSSKYELLLRYLSVKSAKGIGEFLKFDLMPNDKTDINNNGPFSTDMIGMNYDYPEAGYDRRAEIIKEHELYTKGLLYFIGHDQRMPAHLRESMLKWGYPKDEYTETDNWSPQIYVREARRMIGSYVMTQANCEGTKLVDDGIGMAAYTMDSHNTQRLVVNGMVKNEGDVQKGGFGPYPISYRSIIPKASEANNLLVPVCLSATHIAYGSIRMEPVFMVLAQSAAVAAVVAMESGKSVQQVDVKKIQSILKKNPLADGSAAEIVIDNGDSSQVETMGNWEIQKNIGFGPSILSSTGGDAAKSWVKFLPTILKAGNYDLYSYFLPGYNKGAEVTIFTIYDGKTEQTFQVNRKSVNVQGQTSGEWVHLGQYKLPAGKKAYVKINGTNVEGVVVADAIMFRPGFK